MNNSRFFELECGYKGYSWGTKKVLRKIGRTSCIARYLLSAEPSCAINEDEPYAELWMGVHPACPSFVRQDRERYPGQKTLLQALINADERLISHRVASVYGKTLPFLFKVLSVRIALSIQAHPDKTLAETLHRQDPEHYPDANHKPEMAIALTPFEALCGFRPVHEIVSFVTSVRAFRELLGDSASVFIHEQQVNQEKYKESVQNCFALRNLLHTMLTQTAEHIKICINQLLLDIHEKRQDKNEYTNMYKDAYEVILRLNDQFPGDVGIFCVFLLNHVRLMPGEGIFLRANTPHAYLCGEIIECMSSSDNVVRAGLTPKFKDVETLVSMLTYECAPASAQKMKPIRFDRTIGNNKVYLFKPPIDEFNVLQIYIQKDHIQIIKGLKGPSMMICTQGDGVVVVEKKQYSIRTGLVFFVGAFVETKFIANSDSFTVYRAFVEA
ncbi:hypothetical protein PORY_000530 [Pneumocystis oryctolagi]|uniref:Uncharacterized protein n=1 Tax=Pneumocystis oryctolagi TaxID=42067 RepID=A0ACB7CFI0_9ASCO|nr:hypothetical protein PORY_000530 [Pneumocystis oryctolagi]